MEQIEQAYFNNIEGITLSKENAQGFGIPEYIVDVKSGNKDGYWAYKQFRKLSPEEVIKLILEDHGYSVMVHEGQVIHAMLNVMCLVAYEENENGPMTTINPDGRICITHKPLIMTYPQADFTQSHIRKILHGASIESVIEYLRDFGPVAPGRQAYGLEMELDIIERFLEGFGVERLLQMFEVATSKISGLVGWPDLVAIKDGRVDFIEVKTSDSLTKKQKDWLGLFKDLLNINYSIIRLKKSNVS